MTDTKDTNGRRDRRNKRDRKDTRSGTGGDRISRVREMEARLNRIKDWLDGYVTQDIVEDVRLLSEYYQGPLWRSDFEADEAGGFPADLLRGVLSEDGIYNVLTEYEKLLEKEPGKEETGDNEGKRE